MSDVQRADRVARRRAVLLVVVGSLIGSICILFLEKYRPALERWILSDPRESAHRVITATVILAVAITVPLYVFAGYLWLRGARVRRERRFPLPADRPVRDTAIVVGDAAAMKGRLLQVVAVGLAVAASLLAVALWRFASMLANHAA